MPEKNLPIIGKQYTDLLTGFVGTCVAYVQWSTHVDAILDAHSAGSVARVHLAFDRLAGAAKPSETVIKGAIDTPLEKTAAEGPAAEDKPKPRRGRPPKDSTTAEKAPQEESPPVKAETPPAEKAPQEEAPPAKAETPPTEDIFEGSAPAEPAAPPPTNAELIALAKDLVAKKGNNTKPLVELLATFGVNAVSKLPEDRRWEFVDKAKEIYQ